MAFTYTGKKGVATPIPFGDNPKPLIVKFTKPGTVKFYCDLHPGRRASSTSCRSPRRSRARRPTPRR